MTEHTMFTERQQALIDKYRYAVLDETVWTDDAVDDFYDNLPKFYGVIRRSICWSGFRLQGDGASFEGRTHFSLEDTQLLDAIGVSLTNDYPTVARLLRLSKDADVVVDYNRSASRYVHDMTVSFSLLLYPESFGSYLWDTSGPDQTDTEVAVAKALDTKLDAELRDLEDVIADHIRGLMRDLYHRLEKEYEYYTSDECVWDFIVANSLDEEDDDEDDVDSGSGEHARVA